MTSSCLACIRTCMPAWPYCLYFIFQNNLSVTSIFVLAPCMAYMLFSFSYRRILLVYMTPISSDNLGLFPLKVVFTISGRRHQLNEQCNSAKCSLQLYRPIRRVRSSQASIFLLTMRILLPSTTPTSTFSSLYPISSLTTQYFEYLYIYYYLLNTADYCQSSDSSRFSSANSPPI